MHTTEGMAIKAILRRTGILADPGAPCSGQCLHARLSAPAEGGSGRRDQPHVRGLLRATPTMPATAIAERIGWEHGLTVLKDRVRVLRRYYLPPDPASADRIEFYLSWAIKRPPL